MVHILYSRNWQVHMHVRELIILNRHGSAWALVYHTHRMHPLSNCLLCNTMPFNALHRLPSCPSNKMPHHNNINVELASCT